MTTHRTLLFALFTCMLPAACNRQPPAPAPTAAGPARIVSLSPAVSIILRDLGVDGAVVGRHGWERVLPAELPVCGDQAAIDFEALLRVSPTHIITQWGSRDLPPRLRSLAAEHSWALHESSLLSLADLRREITAIDAFVNTSPGGTPAGAALLARLDAALAPRPQIGRAGRVLLLAALDPPGALGPGSCHHEVLLALGGAPAIEQGAPWITLDRERLITLNPDVIVLVTDRSAAKDRWLIGPKAVERLGRLNDLNIPAVNEGRVAVIDDPLALIPASNLADFAAALGDALEALAKTK